MNLDGTFVQCRYVDDRSFSVEHSSYSKIHVMRDIYWDSLSDSGRHREGIRNCLMSGFEENRYKVECQLKEIQEQNSTNQSRL